MQELQYEIWKHIEMLKLNQILFNLVLKIYLIWLINNFDAFAYFSNMIWYLWISWIIWTRVFFDKSCTIMISFWLRLNCKLIHSSITECPLILWPLCVLQYLELQNILERTFGPFRETHKILIWGLS